MSVTLTLTPNLEAQESPELEGGGSIRRIFGFTIPEVAKVTGRTVEQVKEDLRR